MFVKIHHNHKNSVVVLTSARYSAEKLEGETIDCFLLHQETKEVPLENSNLW